MNYPLAIQVARPPAATYYYVEGNGEATRVVFVSTTSLSKKDQAAGVVPSGWHGPLPVGDVLEVNLVFTAV